MQFIVLSEQLKTTLLALFFGVAAAAVYDGVRLLRYLFLPQGRGSVALANVLDVLYGAALGCAYSVFLFVCNNGRYRWYLLCAALLGFALYRLSAGRIIKPFISRAAALVRKILGFLLKLLLWPFRALGKVLGKIRAAHMRCRAERKKKKEELRRKNTADSGRKTVKEGKNSNAQNRKKRNKLYG